MTPITLNKDSTLRDWRLALSALHAEAESPAEQNLYAWIMFTIAWGGSFSRVIVVEAQRTVGRYRVDCAIEVEGKKIAVEVDGFAWHANQTAFQRDRERDRELQLAGYTVLRYTALEAEDCQKVFFSLVNHLSNAGATD